MYVKATEREQQIVAAAIRVLEEVGVPGATMRAVAAAADVPLGTLHYVFPSKDQLLAAVISTVVEEVAASLRSEVSPEHGLEHALRHGVTLFWEELLANRVGLQIMQYELAMYSARSDRGGALARLAFQRYTALLAELCEEAARASGERCAVGFDVLGRLLLAVQDGLIIQYIACPDADRVRGDTAYAVDMVLRLADPRPAEG